MKHRMNQIIPVLITALTYMGMAGTAVARPDTPNLERKVGAALDSYYHDQLTLGTDGNGIVSIRGEVNSLYDKLKIYQIAASVPGVKKVEDLVNVNTSTVDDAAIQSDIQWAIRDDRDILLPDDISVVVSNGAVLLKGTAVNRMTKLTTETIASSEQGVVGIDNEIRILPTDAPLTDANLERVVNGLIRYRFPLIEHSVRVSVRKGDLVLDGWANNLWEEIHLKEECSRLPGVKKVEEYLALRPVA